MDASELGRFIKRIEMRTSLSQADVKTSDHAISISFSNSSTPAPLRLQISCKQLDRQLSSMAQVCDQFSPFLSRVKNLCIQSSSGQDDVDGEQWLELIRAFGGVTDFRVADKLVRDILCALDPAHGGHTTVLPALRHLLVKNPIAMNESSRDDALRSFIALRSLSGRPVRVSTVHQCLICFANFRQEQELKSHLLREHAHRIVCSYCPSFQYTPGGVFDFPEHLRSKHPEVMQNEPIWNTVLKCLRPSISQFYSLAYRHSSVRAPDKRR
ncbi:hypothetical protein BJY52DRAFT_199309 [Lactarius psammicola]|nr:hypothetical protein BJY52DRAFT_199309 [Lactarius psammicola]